MRDRMNVYFPPALLTQIADLADRKGLSRSAIVEAAVVKDLGTSFEQALPQAAQELLDLDLADDDDLSRLLAYLLMVYPSFSLRGGTREILRGIIARGLGLR